MILIIGVGLAALAVIVTVEGLIADRQHRRAETGAAMAAGCIGLLFFIALLAAAGAL